MVARVPIVPQGGPTGTHSRPEHLTGAPSEIRDLRSAQGITAGSWIDPRAMECLVRVDVPHTSEHPLIEEGGFDRA